MNTTEGLMRIALVVRWLGYLIAGGIVVFAIAFTVIASGDVDKSGVLVTVILAAFFAGTGWTLGWIIEGFAKPKS